MNPINGLGCTGDTRREPQIAAIPNHSQFLLDLLVGPHPCRQSGFRRFNSFSADRPKLNLLLDSSRPKSLKGGSPAGNISDDDDEHSGEPYVWQTIRRWDSDKEAYYKSHVGEVVEIVIA